MSRDVRILRDGINVTIGATRIEYIANRFNLIKYTTPESPNISQNPNDTRIVDTLQIEKRYNIDGVISETEGDFGSGDTSQTAVGKRNDLKTIFDRGGAGTSIRIEGTDELGLFEKIMITEIPQDQDPNNPIEFKVKFTFLIGVNYNS